MMMMMVMMTMTTYTRLEFEMKCKKTDLGHFFQPLLIKMFQDEKTVADQKHLLIKKSLLIKIFQDKKTVPNADRRGAMEPAPLHGQFFLSFDFFLSFNKFFFFKVKG